MMNLGNLFLELLLFHFTLSLFLLKNDLRINKTTFKLKITVQQPGEIVHPMAQPKPTLEIPPELRAQMDIKKAKILKRQKKKD